MSLLKTNSVQIGQSATATQNFTLSVPSSPDGTIKLARGNAGATTQDIINVDSLGIITFPSTGVVGKIVQVVNAFTATPVVVSSTTYTDTGLTVSITPTSSSNKILVQASLNVNFVRNASFQGVFCKLFRNSTLLIDPGVYPQAYTGAGGSSSVQAAHTIPFLYMDSPSSTSSLVYKIQGIPYSTANSGTVTFNYCYSSIVVMEVAV